MSREQSAGRRPDDAYVGHARRRQPERRYLWRVGSFANGYRRRICAGQRAQGRVATVAIEAMSFIRPVHVGDVLCVHTGIEREGRSSMAIRIEAWAFGTAWASASR